MAMMALVIAAAPASVVMSRMNETSIFSRWMRKTPQVAQAGIPGPEIVDGKPQSQAPKVLQRRHPGLDLVREDISVSSRLQILRGKLGLPQSLATVSGSLDWRNWMAERLTATGMGGNPTCCHARAA